jgi:hypothetical protein
MIFIDGETLWLTPPRDPNDDEGDGAEVKEPDDDEDQPTFEDPEEE